MKVNSISRRLLIMVTIIAYSCVIEPTGPQFPVGTVEGYRPIYMDDFINNSDPASPQHIEFGAPRKLSIPGKIFTAPPLLLVNDRYTGIHFYDNSDPTKPVNLGFLSIPGNTEVTLRGNVLYVDNFSDLVALDISDRSKIKELSRVAQDDWFQQTPPEGGRYFECVDKSRGKVIGWKLTQLTDPRCFR